MLVVMTSPSRAGSRRSLGGLAAEVPFEDAHRVLGADGSVEPRVGELELVGVAVDHLAVDGWHRAREHDHAVERAADAAAEAGEERVEGEEAAQLRLLIEGALPAGPNPRSELELVPVPLHVGQTPHGRREQLRAEL